MISTELISADQEEELLLVITADEFIKGIEALLNEDAQSIWKVWLGSVFLFLVAFGLVCLG